jgi:hypothetical protein
MEIEDGNGFEEKNKCIHSFLHPIPISFQEIDHQNTQLNPWG